MHQHKDDNMDCTGNQNVHFLYAVLVFRVTSTREKLIVEGGGKFVGFGFLGGFGSEVWGFFWFGGVFACFVLGFGVFLIERKQKTPHQKPTQKEKKKHYSTTKLRNSIKSAYTLPP